ncbi:MAG: squalene/phytoene synthase family protein [Anaerolineales bacterium]|nr:MAG: squalene/phytoene synthase family protein [Anaerolineales bacterium]
MTHATAALARSITRASSKQTYYTVRLMVDRDLVDDCYRAYGYFRWADDIIDVFSQSDDERISFISRQKELINRLYRNEEPEELTPEEEMVADLIGHDRGEKSLLQSYIRNFLAILEFDAHRRGRYISHAELTWYSDRLGRATTDGILYFIGNDHPYPAGEERYRGAAAAHILHMLRDMLEDTADGFINIPQEYLEAHGIGPEDVGSPPFQAWVQGRVEQARRYLCEGKGYLDGLDVLRCKLTGYWYCARYEGVLDTIERDGYVLRARYNARRKLSTWLKMAWLGVGITLRHVVRRGLRGTWWDPGRSELTRDVRLKT